MDRHKKLYSIAEKILDREVKRNFLAERYKKVPDSEYNDDFFDILDALMVYRKICGLKPITKLPIRDAEWFT